MAPTVAACMSDGVPPPKKMLDTGSSTATVAAMERSTRGVVDGAKLSDAAGQALGEISEVSRRLATLIESVTGVVLSLGGIEREVLAELGLNIDADADPVARVDDALQARTGIAAGTPIRVA